MNIDDRLQDDTNNGPIDTVGDNDSHSGLGGENPLNDDDMQVVNSQQLDKSHQQDEDEEPLSNDADQVCIKYRVTA